MQPIAGEGWTFAHFDRVRYGSGNSASAWFADRTPTLLAPNDGGGIFVGAYGCPQLTYAPQVGSGEADNRPWIGETWHLDLSYLPPVQNAVWLAIGTNTAGTISLDSHGVTGCYWVVQRYAVELLTMPPSVGEVTFAIPNAPSLVGAEFLLQGAVQYPSANPAQLLVTRVVHAFVGSR